MDKVGGVRQPAATVGIAGKLSESRHHESSYERQIAQKCMVKKAGYAAKATAKAAVKAVVNAVVKV